MREVESVEAQRASDVRTRLAAPIVEELTRDVAAARPLVAVVVEHTFAIYDVLPVVEALRGRAEVALVAPRALLEAAAIYLGVDRAACHEIETLTSRAGQRLAKYFELALVPWDFSADYAARKARRMSARDAHLKRVIAPVTGRLVRQTNRRFVRTCRMLGLGPSTGSVLARADAVLSFTKVYKPHLLAGLPGRHVNVMESWDHPSKEPYFVYPDVHFTWNSELAARTHALQRLPAVRRCPPLKFRYLFETSWTEGGRDGGRTVYPMCTSSAFAGFDGEFALVRDLAEMLRENGRHLTVRPYPLAPAADTAALKSIGDVEVETYPVATNSLEQLDPAYYEQKLASLRDTALVLNVGTTYAFDAALAGVPVIQIAPSREAYGSFASYVDAEHIRLYLNDDRTLSTNQLLAAPDFDNLLETGRATSRRMRAWLLESYPEFDVTEARTAPDQIVKD